MAINHLTVSRFVNRELARVNRDRSITSVEDAVKEAWRNVNWKRLSGDCSENLGAAEHYLFCRYLTSRHGFWILPMIEAADTFYNLSKLVGIDLREGTCPPIPVSMKDQEWKARGARDGLSDYLGFTSLRRLSAPSTP